MTEPKYTFTAAETRPDGVRIAVTITVPADVKAAMNPREQVSELAQMGLVQAAKVYAFNIDRRVETADGVPF